MNSSMMLDVRSLRQIGRARRTPFVQYALPIQALTGIWDGLESREIIPLEAINRVKEHIPANHR